MFSMEMTERFANVEAGLTAAEATRSYAHRKRDKAVRSILPDFYALCGEILPPYDDYQERHLKNLLRIAKLSPYNYPIAKELEKEADRLAEIGNSKGAAELFGMAMNRFRYKPDFGSYLRCAAKLMPVIDTMLEDGREKVLEILEHIKERSGSLTKRRHSYRKEEVLGGMHWDEQGMWAAVISELVSHKITVIKGLTLQIEENIEPANGSREQAEENLVQLQDQGLANDKR